MCPKTHLYISKIPKISYCIPIICFQIFPNENDTINFRGDTNPSDKLFAQMIKVTLFEYFESIDLHLVPLLPCCV